MITVSFTVNGILPSFKEQLNLAADAPREEIIRELNDLIARADLMVDGKHPTVREVFFISNT